MEPVTRAVLCCVAAALAAGCAAPASEIAAPAPLVAARADPAADSGYLLRDGDTVVFLGDSITAARTYGKIVENYTLLRFPERRVAFFNAGIGGDTAEGGLARLGRDVFARGATVVTVCFGMNDIGWGLRADEEHVRRHLDAIRAIVSQCTQRGVRVFVLSPAVTAADPGTSETDLLQRLGDQAMEAARSLGAETIDVERTMRAIQKRIAAANASLARDKPKTTMHLADGVHLNDLGHMAMAFAILKGLGAPREVSSATIDPGRGVALEASGCKVFDVAATADGVTFTRLDDGLPLNFGLFGALNFLWVPFHAEMNRYTLAVRGLAAGRYDVFADDRKCGTFDAAALAAGVDIASTTADAWHPGGPWDAQASVVSELTDARHDLAKAELLRKLWLDGSAMTAPLTADAARADAALVDAQREAARPRPYRFVVRRAADGKSPAR